MVFFDEKHIILQPRSVFVDLNNFILFQDAMTKDPDLHVETNVGSIDLSHTGIFYLCHFIVFNFFRFLF